MKSKKIKKLSSKQLHVLPYMVTCSSYEEAARQSGVSAKQIYYWLKDPRFVEEMKRQRNAVFSEAIRSLKIASQRAVCALVGCLDDSNPKNRISAADKILAHGFRGVELYEMEERLNEVERRIERAMEKENEPKGNHEKGI